LLFLSLPFFPSVIPLLSLIIPSICPSPISILFPYTTLFRSSLQFLFQRPLPSDDNVVRVVQLRCRLNEVGIAFVFHQPAEGENRSEEHTSELQSRFDLVCRLLLEKKNYIHTITVYIVYIVTH